MELLLPNLNVQNNIINTVVKEFNNIMLKAAKKKKKKAVSKRFRRNYKK